jgi:hypothetical protein
MIKFSHKARAKMVPVLFAAVPFLLRALYVGRFRFQGPLGRPIRYQQAKKWLDLITIVAIGGSEYALVTAGGRWITAIALLVVCAVTDHVMKFKAYRRAVIEVRERIGAPDSQEGDKMAMELVDSDIQSRQRI